jgi:dihydroorotate dehydrogenase (fumarate)
MIDLSTSYLGLTLKNPLVPSAGPLTRSLDSVKRLEDAGASAVVMYSLFEEELLKEERMLDRFITNPSLGHGEADSFFTPHPNYKSGLDAYLEQLSKIKASLSIPVIASLNGVTASGWVAHGKELQAAGADALELNVYYVAADFNQSAADVEARYVNLLKSLKQHVSIPVTMKLSSQFTSLPHFVKQLEAAGADGVSVFNRFYQPDIDLETLGLTDKIGVTSSKELLIRMRWIAVLFGKVKLSLAATGGVHTRDDVLKLLLAGADVTHLCSGLLLQGPELIGQLLDGVSAWMERREYESVAQMKGSLSQQHSSDPVAFARESYIRVLDSYTPVTKAWQ